MLHPRVSCDVIPAFPAAPELYTQRMEESKTVKRTLRKAFVTSLPVMAGYVVLGMGFGILLHNHGYGVPYALAMSLLIYAGSMQYVGVSLLAAGASILTTAMTTIAVNARHLFYSISMISRYQELGRFKPYLVFALTDETYSLLCRELPDGVDPPRFYFFVSMLNKLYWVTGSVLGSLLGAVLPFGTDGIEFSMTALFIATFVQQWRDTREHRPALVGLGCTLLCLMIFRRDRFLIPSMLLITLVLTLLRKTLSGGRERV